MNWIKKTECRLFLSGEIAGIQKHRAMSALTPGNDIAFLFFSEHKSRETTGNSHGTQSGQPELQRWYPPA